jgi:hypothetical protein
MATLEFAVTNEDWVLVANDTDDPFLITSMDEGVYAFCTLATEGDPDVAGHIVALGSRDRLEGVTRASGLVGFVYAKIADNRPAATLTVDGSSVGD